VRDLCDTQYMSNANSNDRARLIALLRKAIKGDPRAAIASARHRANYTQTEWSELVKEASK